MQEMHIYSYDGPVLEFDRVIAEHWRGETTAPTEKKAKCNLAYRFKKQYNKVPGTKIILPGKLVMEE